MRYMDIGEQVDADFTRARRRALVRRIGGRLCGDATSARLLSFEETRKALSAYNRVSLGRRAVPVEKIIGSVDRHTDFDATFLPAKAGLRARWERIDRAYHRGEELPPVVLHRLGDAYFVEDGNHRVSVARFQGAEWIDAEVTYSRARAPEVRRIGTDPATANRPAAA